jgi:hypothetical protein
MTTASSHETRALPLVTVVSRIPILAEALAAALEPHATVQYVAAGAGDTAGLLHHLRPDAVVADADGQVESLAVLARELRFTLLALDLGTRTLRLLDATGVWATPSDADPSAEVIRNIVLGQLLGAGRRA